MPALDEMIQDWLTRQGLAATSADNYSQLLLVGAAMLVAFLANLVAKRLLGGLIRRVAARTTTDWDDALVRHRTFTLLSQLAPSLVLYVSSWLVFPDWPDIQSGFRSLCIAYMVVVVARVVSAVLDAVSEIYSGLEVARSKPIKSYLQMVKVFAFLVTLVLVISTMTGRSPWAFLSGLAGLTAVLILVFKDSLLGLVASIQLTANDMLHVGDWIEMKEFGADGDVIDISLNTVKVQNWDKTISTIPTYALVANSFRNWRGMSESGGRRIKRAIFLDMNSVRFLDAAALDQIDDITLLKDYLDRKRTEIREDEARRKVDPSHPANTRRLTNLGTFRAYVEAYLRAHPKIHKDMTLLVRQLAPGPEGVGIEVYAFSNDQVWANYEALQGDIFDHIISVLPDFGLRPFQNPAGSDLRGLCQPTPTSKPEAAHT